MSESTQRLDAALAAALRSDALPPPDLAPVLRRAPPGETPRADRFAGPHLCGLGAHIRPRSSDSGTSITTFHSLLITGRRPTLETMNRIFPR